VADTERIKHLRCQVDQARERMLDAKAAQQKAEQELQQAQARLAAAMREANRG